MPKSLFIDPAVVRAPGKLSFDDIPLNTYQKTVKDELGNFTRQQFLDIYRDMFLLREFETMINLIKTTGEYNGVAYNHPGPAHLSMGQEASAVGQAFHLTVTTPLAPTAATAKSSPRAFLPSKSSATTP